MASDKTNVFLALNKREFVISNGTYRSEKLLQTLLSVGVDAGGACNYFPESLCTLFFFVELVAGVHKAEGVGALRHDLD